MIEIRFDFYKVKSGLEDVLISTLELMAKKKSDELFYKIGSDKCILSQHKSFNGIKTFLFTRIRMEPLPVKTRLTGERADLELDEDEGLGEDVAIAYDKKLKVLAIQRNIHSITSSSILDWIKKESENSEIELYPILKKDSIKRFLELGCLRKISYRLARPSNLSFLNNNELSESSKLTIQKMLMAPFISMTLSCGREKDCSLNDLISFVKSLVHLNKENHDFVRALEVTGYEDEINSSPIVIDLLEDKLIAKIKVDQKGRTVQSNELLKAASSAISRNKGELENYVDK